MASIQRSSLKLVARRRIAMLQMGIDPRIDLLHPSPVKTDFDLSVPDLLDRSEIPVQDIPVPVVPEKQNPGPRGKVMKRFFRPSQGQIPDGLPVGGETLSSDIRKLHKSCPLLEEAEGRSGLNRLELFRIPTRTIFAPAPIPAPAPIWKTG